MLKRKLLRDLWQNRTQFISIFLMAFLGLFVFAGIDAESTGIGISTAQYYEETNLADNWVMGTSFSTEEVKRLEALPQIASVDRKLVLEGKAKVGDGEEPSMEFNFVESMNSSFPYIKEGEAFDVDKEGVWLENCLLRSGIFRSEIMYGLNMRAFCSRSRSAVLSFIRNMYSIHWTATA